jgi:signal transduction histidine kinase
VLDALCILAVPLVNPDWLLVIMVTANAVLLLLAFFLSVLSLLTGQAGVRLLSVGLMLFVVMVIWATLSAYGLLPTSLFSRYGYELGLTVLVDVFFIAVVAKIFSAETEKWVIENQMVKLNADIRARGEFVDKVTHDIKSPLSAVIGSVPLLRNAATQEQREKYYDVIQHSCGAVLAIIDDILGFSRLQSGQMMLQLERVNLETLLAEIKNSVEVIYQNKPVQLALVINEAVPQWVMGDRTRLYQLFNNLLTNAFKFTDEGRVSLALDLVEKKAGKVVVRFVVQDTGIGMSEEFLLTAFEPYAREINNAGYRPGFGLGLPICKQIVELMGGTIDVMSVLGQGSRFTVVLPFDIAQ